MADVVEVDVHDGVATILLNRPKMNALNLQMQREIRAAAEEISGRADVGAVVLHGGPKVFAAGADVKEMADMSFQEMSQAAISLQGSFTAVAAIPQPTIAAVTGYALGGGCELAMCCDIRIAADDAQFGQPEILLRYVGDRDLLFQNMPGPVERHGHHGCHFPGGDERFGQVDQLL